MKVTLQHSDSTPCSIEALMKHVQGGDWFGKANILDMHHLYDWPIIDEVAEASRFIKDETTKPWSVGDAPTPLPCKTTLQAKSII